MIRKLSLLLALAATGLPCAGRENYREFDEAPHDYWTRPLRDRFTSVKDALESGALPLDRSSEKAFVVSLLRALDVPVSSQMLVFSTTSLQLSRISRRNPRAIYFTDDVYVGWVPGGQIEIASLDPELGAVFYIFDIPRGDRPVAAERANRCMNCHSGADTRYVPGLAIESVMPGPNGGGLKAWRQEDTGHQIPFADRFGGWFVTGSHSIGEHKGNKTGRLSPAGLTTTDVPPGTTFSFDRYPVPTSHIAAQLLHEHQAGFVNRAVEATYRARSAAHRDGASLSEASAAELDAAADAMVRYLLFADECALPAPGIEPDPAFAADFARNRRSDAAGRSLRDLDMKSRLLRYRCSYMIYSPVFEGMHPAVRSRTIDRLKQALDPEAGCDWLPAGEKRAILEILTATLPDFRDEAAAESG